jgi:hypothetical protein
MRRGAIAIGMLFCGILALAVQAHAFDDSYSFSGFGEGNRTCDEFIAARQSESAARASRGGADNVQYTMSYAAIYAFIEGWVTGADLFLPRTYSLFPDGLEPAMTWLENYCRQNPSKKLAAALPLLWLDAFPNREQAAPK